MKDIFKVQINLDEDYGGNKILENVSGNLIITANENVSVKEIDIRLLLNIRGKLTAYDKLINSSKPLYSKKQFLQGAEYQFPFAFLQNSGFETYNGDNVSFVFELEVAIDLEKEEYERLRTGFFEKVIFMLAENYPLKYSKHFVFKKESKQYLVEEEYLPLKVDGSNLLSNLLSVVFAIITGVIFYLFVPISGIEPISVFFLILILGLISRLIGGYLSDIFTRVLIGRLRFKVKPYNEECFTFMLMSEKKWKPVIHSKIYYTIVEEVTDKRGTSSQTYTQEIYVSNKKQLQNKFWQSEIQFNYPKVKNINTIRIKNVVIRWMVNLELTTYLGLKVMCFGEFKVRKE